MNRFDRKITPVHYTALIKVFELEGFEISREKGDHIIMTRAGVKRPLVMQYILGFYPLSRPPLPLPRLRG